MEREEKKKPFPSLPTLPWKARKLASFPHSHSLGDDLEFLSSPSSFNFNFDEKCYPHAQYLLLLTCPFAQNGADEDFSPWGIAFLPGAEFPAACLVRP